MNLNDFNFFLLLVFLLTQPGEEMMTGWMVFGLVSLLLACLPASSRLYVVWCVLSKIAKRKVNKGKNNKYFVFADIFIFLRF